MKDKLLEMFFDIERWTKAIEKGVGKDIRKDQLIKLCDEKTRVAMYVAMRDGKYQIAPPHTAQIPKDVPGEFRTVYINEPMDRVVLSIANDLLFETCKDMIHPACKSYQTGIGCGKVVKEASRMICDSKKGIYGFKADLSKYFDSVPLKFIDNMFDEVEKRHGKSKLIKVLRDYYHCDLYFDDDNNLQNKYQSLKQGCAVASWLADTVLYELDEKMTKLGGFYVRYSDDILFIGENYNKAMVILAEHLSLMEMQLNPKKVEYLSPDHWFKFLGYSIKGKDISISSTRIKTFQKEIEKRTIKDRTQTYKKAVNRVNRYLYKGDGKHSWATQILPVCNVVRDLNELNKFVMDCLRAVQTGKRKVGGLGYVKTQKNGCVARGTGRNVKANRGKIDKIEGYMTISCMRNALLTSRSVYETLVIQL